MNYNNEVPFEHLAPNFVFEVGTGENPEPNLNMTNINLQQFEGERKDTKEDVNKKSDEQKLKKLKQHRLDIAIERMTKMNNAVYKSRTKLVLPKPQLLDKDIETIGELNAMQADQLGQTQQASVTRGLVGNYSMREPTPTPLRTPRYEDKLMQQARDNLALQ